MPGVFGRPLKNSGKSFSTFRASLLVLLALSIGLYAFSRQNAAQEAQLESPALTENITVEDEEEIDYEEFMNRLPLRKPEKPKLLDIFSKNEGVEDVG